MTDSQKLQDHAAALALLHADPEFPPSSTVTECVRSLLIRLANARRATVGWREQVLSIGEADERAALRDASGLCDLADEAVR
jgi:hypothetical protein